MVLSPIKVLSYEVQCPECKTHNTSSNSLFCVCWKCKLPFDFISADIISTKEFKTKARVSREPKWQHIKQCVICCDDCYGKKCMACFTNGRKDMTVAKHKKRCSKCKEWFLTNTNVRKVCDECREKQKNARK